MKNWRTLLATVTVAGLITLPIAVQADEEESGEGGHKAHPATPGEHAHKGVKKAVKSKGEGKKADTAAEEGAAEHHHDGHDMHEGGVGDTEEGSH